MKKLTLLLLVLGVVLADVPIWAKTYSLPGNAIFDMGELTKSRFRAKWGGGEIPDGMRPVRPGDYVTYRHEQLTYYFGPYRDRETLARAQQHLDALIARARRANSKYDSAETGTVEIGGDRQNEVGEEQRAPPSGGEEARPVPEQGEQGERGEQGEQGEQGERGEQGEVDSEPSGAGEQSAEQSPGEGGGEPPDEGEQGQPGEGKPGQKDAGEQPTQAAGEQQEGEEQGEAEGEQGEAAGEEAGEQGEQQSEQEEQGEASERQGEEGEQGEAQAEQQQGEEGEQQGEQGEQQAAEAEEQQADRPPDVVPPDVHAQQPPPDWPPPPPQETTPFEEEDSGTELAAPEDLEGVRFAWPPFFGRALPQRVDWTGELPVPGDQGAESSCVSWVLAYGLKSFQEQREEKWSLGSPTQVDERHVFSPAYLHHQIYNPKTNGALVLDGLRVARDRGVCLWPLQPYSVSTARDKAGPGAHRNAAQYRIDFFRLVKAYSNAEVKAQLAAGFPVVIGLLADPSYEKLRGDVIWKTEAKGPPAPHALLVIGYDDERQAFKVLNSWGKRWGSGGYGWIDYEAFSKMVPEAYVVKDGRNDAQRVSPAEEAFTVAIEEHEEAGGVATFSGTFAVAPDYPGAAKVVVQLYAADGKPQQATEQRYATVHGQAANDSEVLVLPLAGAGVWEVALPRAALASDAQEFVAEAVLFVDDFGLVASERYRFSWSAQAAPEEEESEAAEEVVEEEEEVESEVVEVEDKAEDERAEVSEREVEGGVGPEGPVGVGPGLPVRWAVFLGWAVLVVGGAWWFGRRRG